MADVLPHVSQGGAKIDSNCRNRREEVRSQISGHQKGGRLPEISYTAAENILWQTVISRLNSVHNGTACARYLEAAERLTLPTSHVPSLQGISDMLKSHSGFELLPAADLVPARDFYCAFADGYFYSTMYMRCPAVPYYSPDPDILHELVGHAVMLSDPLFAALYRDFGKAASLARSDDEVMEISKVFWFTMEMGLVRESGGLRAYGAALISSAEELTGMTHVSLQEFSIENMLRQTYDIYQTQPVLFVVDSFDLLSRELRAFLNDRPGMASLRTAPLGATSSRRDVP